LVEVKERDVAHVAGMETFNKQNTNNLQCFVIYWLDCAWEFLHFLHIVYLTFTEQFKQSI